MVERLTWTDLAASIDLDTHLRDTMCHIHRTSMNISRASCAAVSSPAFSTCAIVLSMSGTRPWNLSLSLWDSKLCRQGGNEVSCSGQHTAR